MLALLLWWAGAIAGAALGAWVWIDATETGRRLRRAGRLLELAEQVPERGLQTDLRITAGLLLSGAVRPGRRAHVKAAVTIAVVLTGMLLAAPLGFRTTEVPADGWAAGMWTAVLAAYWLEVPSAWGYVAWLTR